LQRVNLAWLSAEFGAYAVSKLHDTMHNLEEGESLLVPFLVEFRSLLLALNDSMPAELSGMYKTLRKLEFQRNQAIKELVRTRAKVNIDAQAYISLRNSVQDIRGDLVKLSQYDQFSFSLNSRSSYKVPSISNARDKKWIQLIALSRTIQASGALVNGLQRTSFLHRENERKLYYHLELNRQSTERVQWHFNHTLFLLREKQALIFSGLKLLHAKLFTIYKQECGGIIRSVADVQTPMSSRAYGLPGSDTLEWRIPARNPQGRNKSTSSLARYPLTAMASTPIQGILAIQNKQDFFSFSLQSTHYDICTSKYNSAAFLIRRHYTNLGVERELQDSRHAAIIAESENKYQIAMTYVKHLEKILRKMNREVTKYKEEVAELRSRTLVSC
jgi:hypothetical protein